MDFIWGFYFLTRNSPFRIFDSSKTEFLLLFHFDVVCAHRRGEGLLALAAVARRQRCSRNREPGRRARGAGGILGS